MHRGLPVSKTIPLAVLFIFMHIGELAYAQFTPLSMWQKRTGFLVISQPTTGNIGGLAGAKSKCQTDLTSTWKGKPASIDNTKVRAFLCDGSTCNNLLPNTYYTFASVIYPAVGGAFFLTDASGNGPGDSAQWDAEPYFGVNSAYYWTGRQPGSTTIWSDQSVANQCANWTRGTNGGGFSGVSGYSAATDSIRWNDTVPGSCGSNIPIICIVDP